MKIINSTIAVTNDNWKTTKAAVGKYYYSDNGVMKMAYGVNAETIVGKLILGEQLKIDNKDGSMSFDDTGFIVKNNLNTVAIDPADNTPIFSIKKNDAANTNIFSIDSGGNLVVTGKIVATDVTFLNSENVNNKDITGIADVALTGSYNDLKDKPALKTVATTGDYGDLINKPLLATVATSGNYNDLINKPALKPVATSGKYSDLTGTPVLKTVATSGKYSDLTGTPVLKTVATSGKYTDLSGPTGDAGKLLYVDTDGSVTTLSINDLKTKLGI